MIPIAAVLLLIVVVFSVAVVVSNPSVFDLSIFGAGVPVTTAGVYFTGAGAMLVVILALALLRRGVKRDLARRRQVRALQNAAGVKSLPIATRQQSAARREPTVPSDQRAATPSTAADANQSAASTAGSTTAGSSTAGSNTARSSSTGSSTAGSTSTGSSSTGSSTSESSSTGSSTTGSSSTGSTTAERPALLDEAEELAGGGSER